MCKGECGIGPFIIGVRPEKRRGVVGAGVLDA
jgi:hypothetical protein